MRNNDTASASQRESTSDAAQSRRGRLIAERIAEAIRAGGGWIAFEAFMDLALYAPGLGYYSAESEKFGELGDFITAPEISPLFGACVARQCAEVLGVLPGGGIFEIGAGTGRMAADLLEALQAAGRLPAHYSIFEISADLRARQRTLLGARVPHLIDRIRWLDALPAPPFDGVIIANEVLDALPVTRFRWLAGQIEELGVSMRDGEFCWSPRAAPEPVAAYCRRLQDAGGPWPDAYRSEFSPRLTGWAAAVTAALGSGVVLWFDYGLPRSHYYFPERSEGTLLCHFRHRVVDDPLCRPGLQDITAWVDFTLLAEAGRDAGFEIAGYTTQSYFLAGAGIDREMQRLSGADPGRFAALAGQARRLMLPGEMGERFKAMAWRRGVSVELSGFALRDLRHTL